MTFIRGNCKALGCFIFQDGSNLKKKKPNLEDNFDRSLKKYKGKG